MKPSRSLLLVPALLVACNSEAPAPGGEARATERERPLVVTTFYPTEFLTQRLAGDLVDVRCDVPEDADALFWMPDDEQVLAYQQADLVVLNGAGLEVWVDKVSLPPSRVVDSSKPYSERLLTFETVTHSHGDSGEHSHEGVDPHTWLDPQLLSQQAAEIHAALVRVLPEEGDALGRNLRALQAELEAIDHSFANLGRVPEDVKLYANHPAYNYMARRYGWRIHNFDLDPESMPDDHDLEHLAEDVDREKRGFLLWESAPLPEIASKLEEELGLASIVVTPAELLGSDERAAGFDLVDLMQANLEALRPVFEE